MDNGQYPHTNDLSAFLENATVDVDAPVYASKERIPKNIKRGLILTALGAGAVVASSGALFISGVNSALEIKKETVGEVVDPGTATIQEVSMDMPPITLATADTKVEKVKVSFEQKLTGLFDISLGENTVTRDANVETRITLNPGEVNISYDSEEDQLTFSAPNTALSTKVDIPTGEVRTVDKTGNLAMLPAEWLTKISEAVDGTFGTDNSKVPIVREMAAGTLAINEGLETYADLNIVTQVDKECTPLIPQEVEDFNDQLKDNIRTAVKGELLDTDAARNEVSKALMDMPLSKVQELVDDSVVEIPENFTIGPDQENITKLEDYIKSQFFTSTLTPETPIACGVSNDTQLTLLDEGNE
jgi:hypothetical protein